MPSKWDLPRLLSLSSLTCNQAGALLFSSLGSTHCSKFVLCGCSSACGRYTLLLSKLAVFHHFHHSSLSTVNPTCHHL